ncbi:MAG: thiamine-phosphate kinase [Actinomycetota bacterium]|nr:thiamine-phosphate kinase [Actinomycetota bacterium]
MNPAAPSEHAVTEDELVAAIRRVLSGQGPGVLAGVGDDAALVETGSGDAVLTTDLLVEGVHFDRSIISARDLGYKAMVVNVSDVAAMAASPRYALVSVAVSKDVGPAWVMELYGGLRAACGEYALSLVGGDLSRGGEVVISVSVVGEVPRGRAVLRSGAIPGQRLVVTGVLGASAGGLLLARGHGTGSASAVGSEWGHALIEAHCRPVARVGEAQTLAQVGATAMMDISDGLALDLSRLCAESSVGARVELDRVPIAPALKELAGVLQADPLELALSGGEDYELLAVLDPLVVEKARTKLEERFGVPLTDIGDITETLGLVAVDASGAERPLEPRGWDHLAAG